jgi:YebC/PmpR family DNA-binding regulatory protein
MAGHSHWAGIKRQKKTADKKRGVVFSRLLAAITAAARTEPNPDFNPRLRTAVQKAKEGNVPADNIDRALKRASEPGAASDELVLEAYGPGGIALLIEALSTSKNRTVAEIKKLLGDGGGKWAESGSVRWAFAAPSPGASEKWRAKFLQAVSAADASALAKLVAALESHADVQAVYTNAEE